MMHVSAAQEKVGIALALAGAAVLFSAGAAPVTAEQEIAAKSRSVFQMPKFADEQRRHTVNIQKLFRRQQYVEAEKQLRKLILEFPDWPRHHVNLAVILARQDKTNAALDSLELALAKGFANRRAIESVNAFNTLRGLPRFQSLLDQLQRPALQDSLATRIPNPPRVENRLAAVEESNTAWDPVSNTVISAFSFADRPESNLVRTGDDEISKQLNLLYGQQKAAGNHGDLYDNRDNDHSRLRRKTYPQLAHTRYSATARAAGLHHGVNSHQLFNAITIGNSSTALTSGAYWRSQARLIQTNPLLMSRAFQHYANNHLYVFPEHADHDPGNGDLYPANTPYMLVSQGSSGSDQPILNALAAILAAFDPSVKTFLRSRHLVMPTVQMVFRSGLKSLKSDDDYLTGKAHPPVFDGADLDVPKMISLANNLRRDEIPPRVNIKVIDENTPVPGITYFGPGQRDEVLFNTPGAIARTIRSTDIEKRMVVDAAGTIDPNGHPLKFKWRVLQGDPNLIAINSLKQDGSRIELKVKWHERRPVKFRPQLTSSRVDIAVFAHNGFNYSAPAFISLSYPIRQRRVYDTTGRIREISYDPEDTSNIYQDPVLFPRRGWRDLYAYTSDGKFVGWDRVRANEIENFTRDGARVIEKDEQGRAVKAERVVYTLKPNVREVITVPSGDFLVYRYKSRQDRIGTSSVVAGD